MRYARYIVAFVALILAAACTISDIDDAPIKVAGSKSQLQVVGRISQYSDCNVATRSKKENDEPKVTSMGLALFPIEDDGVIGNCLYYDFQLGGSIVFIVDRHDEVFKNYDDKNFAMYIFANMQDAEGFPTTAEDGKGKSLTYFKNCAVTVTSNIEDVPANGFPMMGSLGDSISANDKDGGSLKLKPTIDGTNPDGLPVVNGSPTDNLEIPLKAMYAKFSFTITVTPDQEIVGNKTPRFDITSYRVHNLPSSVDTASDTNSDSAVIDMSDATEPGNYAQGAATATFDFYLPERYLSPNTTIDNVLPDALKKGTYDTTVDKDQNGYRDEDERYHQRYKPLLVKDKAATYLTIEGYYTDHQVNTYKVSYDIYLGANNTNDFNIKRNTHYINSVTIRGISSSDNQSLNPNGISIDHRVTVEERSLPLIVNFRREALLDAHYEVRPLRLRSLGDATATTATVEILNEKGETANLPDWIRLEASGNTSDHITSDGVSAGKRKYFTTDLVTTTLASGTRIEVNGLSNTANQTVWVYVDENLTTQSRAAIVRISYNGKSDDFKVVQNGLYHVAVNGRNYYLEQYEEYLYNYDAEESFGQTKDEGMPWGLNGVQLSSEHYSFDPDLTPDVNWSTYETKATRPYYDFYIASQDGEALANGGTSHSFAGEHFTSDIYKKSQGKSSQVNNLTMAEQASGAVEYCYNRNKRNSDGSIPKVMWYLPSADELEEFIVPAYSTFEEFQDNYYWTSQPAYCKNIFYYEVGSWSKTIASPTVYDDNTGYARATKVKYENGQYIPAPSGLNYEPKSGINRTQSGYTNLGWFYQMHYWKGSSDYGPNKAGTQTGGDERYSYNNKGYYIHLGFLEDLMQEGCHLRTRSNRVRCVRADLTTNNQQMVLVYTVSKTPATTLDKSGSTMYVMRNTNNTGTALTTSGSNLAAETITDANLDFDNYVVIESNKIKSVAKNQYFNGNNGSVSFSDSGTDYTINNTNTNQFTISARRIISTNYLRQTSQTSVTMTDDSSNRNWYFYEVKQEYKVVE